MDVLNIFARKPISLFGRAKFLAGLPPKLTARSAG